MANEVAKKTKEIWSKVILYPWKTYKDADLRRQFHKLSILGSAALPPEKFEKLNKIVSDMEGIYSKGKICSYTDPNKCDLSLEPGKQLILYISE